VVERLAPVACLTSWPKFNGRIAQSFLPYEATRDCSKA
jgi:hypothetical protein